MKRTAHKKKKRGLELSQDGRRRKIDHFHLNHIDCPRLVEQGLSIPELQCKKIG
jgi:hypothetical protein